MKKSRKVKVLNWKNIELWRTVDLFGAPRETPSFLSQKKHSEFYQIYLFVIRILLSVYTFV